MALHGSQIPISFQLMFPHGAYVLGVEAINDYEKAKAGLADPQERDRDSGERLWAVRVLDADPEARPGTAEVKVKVPAPVQPVPPASQPGSPFCPVEFDGLTVTPYVDTNRTRPRLAYSLRAKGLRAPSGAAAASSRLDGSRVERPGAAA